MRDHAGQMTDKCVAKVIRGDGTVEETVIKDEEQSSERERVIQLLGIVCEISKLLRKERKE